MDSNSTLAPNPHSSSWKGEGCCVKEDHVAMATYNDNHSESDHCIAYPAYPRPRLRIDSRIKALPEHEKKQRPVSSSLQEGDLFHDSLVVSGAKSRPSNPWAPVGSVTLLSLLLLALVVIPLFHTDTLPKRETLTMLYVLPAAAASNVTRLPVPTSTSRNTPTNMRIPSAVHTTQEAPPSPPLDTAGGLVGGVPGGVVGGIPGGVLSEVLRSTGSAPVLAKTPAPTPKRIRVPARIAKANLVYDVAPKYPPEAGRARIEGTVVLLAVIGKDGTVEDVRVKSGLSLLAQAAIEAVKQWRYRPYLLNGEPVEVDSQITINFTLSRG
jgi:periplasmic protein TonB